MTSARNTILSSSLVVSVVISVPAWRAKAEPGKDAVSVAHLKSARANEDAARRRLAAAKRDRNCGGDHWAERSYPALVSFSIAQVTPWPWEQHHEVNLFVERLSDELCRRGHRVLVVTPSGSRELVREGRAKIKALRSDPEAVFAEPGCASLVAVGQSLPFRRGGSVSLPLDVSRTLEDLLGRTELDFVHVHEPFAPSASSAALRHSRALNVGTFHSTTERFVSTQVARRMVELRALAGGAVPVVSRLPQYEEAVREGELGPLFEPRDALTLAAQLERLLAEPSVVGEYKRRIELAHPDILWSRVAEEFEGLYERIAARRHAANGPAHLRRRLLERDFIHVDLHMHTDHSPDCATPVDTLLDTAKRVGLGAIAITDHNEISGALEARERADGRVKVIVAEEVKTADQGEVIGLFIEEKIERGMSLQETIAEIRRQD